MSICSSAIWYKIIKTQAKTQTGNQLFRIDFHDHTRSLPSFRAFVVVALDHHLDKKRPFFPIAIIISPVNGVAALDIDGMLAKRSLSMAIDAPVGLAANENVIHLEVVFPAVFRLKDYILGVGIIV